MLIYLYESVKFNARNEIEESMEKKIFMDYFGKKFLTFSLFAQTWIVRENSSLLMIFVSETSLIFDTIDEQQQ